MRKIVPILSVALMFFASCSKENYTDTEKKTLAFTAVLEQHTEETKTSLSGANVVWTKDDAIVVFDKNGLKDKLVAETGGSSTHFVETGDKDPNFEDEYAEVAMYPYDAATEYDKEHNKIIFNLPEVQHYAEGSFSQDANITVARVQGSTLAFKNVCGILKVQLKGTFKVGKIEVSSKTGEKMSGCFSTTIQSTSEPSDIPEISVEGTTTDADRVVTLDCGEGVQLDPERARSFYIVIPAGVFSSGFTATVYDAFSDNTHTFTVEVETDKNRTITRSRMRSMTSKTVSLLQNVAGYIEVTYVKNEKFYDTDSDVTGPYFELPVKPQIPLYTELEATVYPVSPGQDIGAFMGTYVSDSNFRFYMFGVTSVARFYDSRIIGLWYNTGRQCNFGSKETWILDLAATLTETFSVVDADGNNVLTPLQRTFINTIPSNVGNISLGFNPYEMKARPVGVYGLRMKAGQTGDILLYGIPAIRTSDGEPGLYDVMSGSFIINSGDEPAEAFVAGPVVD